MSSFPAIRAGRTSVAPTPHAPNAALLIDFDNVTLGVRSDLAKELRSLLNSEIIKGKVAVQRAYADWRRYPQYIVPLSESSIDLIFAPAFGTNKKNATDIRLAVDAIELVFTRPEIGTFILLSGDSDFSSMVLKLKEYGKYVIGVGIRESASDILIQNCDEYYSYSDLAGLAKESEAPAPRDPWELVAEAVRRMVTEHDVMRSDRLKQVMQQMDPAFDEHDAGYNRFSKFVIEAGHRGLIKVIKLENGQFEVAPAGAAEPQRPTRRGGARGATPTPEAGAPAAAPSAAPTGEAKSGRSRRGRRGRGHGAESPAAPAPAGNSGPDGLTLAEAFHLLGRALNELPTPVAHESLRARMAAIHGREDPLLDPVRFPRLLRQANDAEVADVRLLGEDRFEVSPHKADLALQVRPSNGAATESAPTPRPSMALRFRGGSRSGGRAPELNMVGVVDLGGVTAAPTGNGQPNPEPGDSRSVAASAPVTPDDTVAATKAAKSRRGSRGGRGRGRKATGESTASAETAPAAPTSPVKKEKAPSRRRGSRTRAE